MESFERYFCFCFVAFCLVSLAIQPVCAMNQVSGVVEGFYWPSSDAVFGQYGSFSFVQRLELLSLMSSLDLGLYWYAPQSISTMALFTDVESDGWRSVVSLSSSFGIRVVYGLRPGYLDLDVSSIVSKVQELHDIGFKSYSLNFDDASGASSSEQKNRQISLSLTLNSTFPDMTAYVFVPSEYYQTHDGDTTTPQQWSDSLKIADEGLNVSVAFGLTGPSITPSSMSPSQFPPIPSSRRMIFWDNWIAVDTNTRLPWGLLSNGDRIDQNLFSPSFGYVLNLAYPLERNIHQIYCLGYLANGLNTTCQPQQMANKWAAWLFDQGFAHQHSTNAIASALNDAIQNDPSFNTIADLETAYPDLEDVFSTPPDISLLPSSQPDNGPEYENPNSQPNTPSSGTIPNPTEPSTPENNASRLSLSLLQGLFTLFMAPWLLFIA